MNESDLNRIRSEAENVFRCGVDSIHGFGHWCIVEDNFLLIAETNGADVFVGRLFANNHFEGCAPLTIDRLKQRLAK
ncbi:MAG: hypothetical protein WCI03_10460 [bacterium]